MLWSLGNSTEEQEATRKVAYLAGMWAMKDLWEQEQERRAAHYTQPALQQQQQWQQPVRSRQDQWAPQQAPLRVPKQPQQQQQQQVQLGAESGCGCGPPPAEL